MHGPKDEILVQGLYQKLAIWLLMPDSNPRVYGMIDTVRYHDHLFHFHNAVRFCLSNASALHD
jgi:hypothetical protein